MDELHLNIPQGDRAITLRNISGQEAGLGRLAELLGTCLCGADAENPAELVVTTADAVNLENRPLQQTAEWRLDWNRDSLSFSIALLKPALVEDDRWLVHFWRIAMAYSMIAAMLRGRKIMQAHGALLVLPRGGILLCGESGVGKSTTAQRWRDSGGAAPADDSVLLDYGGEAVWAYPLPTWSRCGRSLENEYYPIRQGTRVQAVFGLGRGAGREEIRPVSGNDFCAQIYRSAFFNPQWAALHLPEPEQRQLVRAVQNGVTELTRRFPPQGLFAQPECDLRRTLKDYL